MADFIHLSDGGVNLPNVSAYTIDKSGAVILEFSKDHRREFKGEDAVKLLEAIGHPKNGQTKPTKPSWGGPVTAPR